MITCFLVERLLFILRYIILCRVVDLANFIELSRDTYNLVCYNNRMMKCIKLTSVESLAWENMSGLFLSSDGSVNHQMVDTFSTSLLRTLPSADYKRDYSNELTKVTAFLKTYPQQLAIVFPTLYKSGNKNSRVIELMDGIKEYQPERLKDLLTTLFAQEKSWAMQIVLMMDIRKYLDDSTFANLDFKTLLKVPSEKVLKLCSPTIETFESFMMLAVGLAQNEETRPLSSQIAYSVAYQASIAMPRPKDERHEGIQKYDWLAAFDYWKAHNWSWDVGHMIESFKKKANSLTLVLDLIVSCSVPGNGYPEKSLEVMKYINMSASVKKALDNNEFAQSLDNAVFIMYKRQARDNDVKKECLAWFNERAANCYVFDLAIPQMPIDDLQACTHKLIQDVLSPINFTQATSFLPNLDGKIQFPGNQIEKLGLKLNRLVNRSNLPIGDVDHAMVSILHKWFSDFSLTGQDSNSYDFRASMVRKTFEAICDDLQSPMRKALQESNGFKQLLLYAVYQFAVQKNSTWTNYSSGFISNITDMPLAALYRVYPEHQDTWSKIQLNLLDGSFNREDALPIISSVFFNNSVTLNDVANTCTILECTPEQFFSSFQASTNRLFISDKFDFNTEQQPCEKC